MLIPCLFLSCIQCILNPGIHQYYEDRPDLSATRDQIQSHLDMRRRVRSSLPTYGFESIFDLKTPWPAYGDEQKLQTHQDVYRRGALYLATDRNRIPTGPELQISGSGHLSTFVNRDISAFMQRIRNQGIPRFLSPVRMSWGNGKSHFFTLIFERGEADKNRWIITSTETIGLPMLQTPRHWRSELVTELRQKLSGKGFTFVYRKELKLSDSDHNPAYKIVMMHQGVQGLLETPLDGGIPYENWCIGLSSMVGSILMARPDLKVADVMYALGSLSREQLMNGVKNFVEDGMVEVMKYYQKSGQRFPKGRWDF